MHAFSALAASVGSPKTGEEYSGQRSIVEPLRPSDTSPKTGEEYMRSQNFLLHTEAKYPTYCPPASYIYTKTWQPTYCPPVLGGRELCSEGVTPYSLLPTPYSLLTDKQGEPIVHSSD